MKAAVTLFATISLGSAAQAADWSASNQSLRGGYVAIDRGWSGPYAGGHLGHGWGSNTNDWSNDVTPWTLDGDIAYQSVSAGALLGYQHQFGQVVAGVEADFTVGRFRGDDAQFAGLVNTIDINAMGSFRGRLGWAHGEVMVYGTAGVAAAAFHKGEAGIAPVTPQLAVGWTAGAGAEWAATDNVRVRTEFLHTRLSDIETNLGYLHRANAPTINTWRAGAIFQF